MTKPTTYQDTDSPEEQLRKLRKANKTAREIRAKRRGFDSAQAYRESLENPQPQPQKTLETPSPSLPVTESNDLPLFHFVPVLDRSASMGGRDIRVANQGITDELKKLKETHPEALYTLVDFGTDVKLGKTTTVANTSHETIYAGGYTALCTAVCKTIEKVRGTAKFINITVYTDGSENYSSPSDRIRVKTLIEEVKDEGITVALFGPQSAIRVTKMHLGIDESNIATYDGTTKGYKQVMVKTQISRQTYAARAVGGKDVSVGFYINM